MQRQSLGSPISKVHGHGGDDTLIGEDPKRRVVDDDDESKATKPRRLSFTPSYSAPPLSFRPEKFIHLIPVLTLLCFLILYLSSHNPSQSDLAHYDGLKRSSKRLDSSKISNIRGFFELRIGDALAIRSIRNLQELEKQRPKSRSHRKIADF